MTDVELRCKGWQQEAALRMLENNLHPDVAENPAELVVYGGIGKAARNWPSYHAIVRELQQLGDDETLLVQSGKPVAVFETHEHAPRVLIANSNLVPDWANWDDVPRARRGRTDHVRADDRRLVDLHRQSGDPAGHLRDVRRGRAQALRRHARRAAGASPPAWAGWAARSPCRSRCSAAPRCASRSTSSGSSGGSAAGISMSGRPIWTTRCAGSTRPARERRALSIGLAGNAAEVLPELVRRGVDGRRRHRPDLGARSAERLHPRRAHPGTSRGAAPDRS